MGLSLKIKGKGFERMADDIPAAIAKATKANAEDLRDTARRKVKVRTGRTRDSIRVKMTSPTQGQLQADYGAVFLEYGTRYMPAQPWAAPAVEEVRPRAIARVDSAIKGAIT